MKNIKLNFFILLFLVFIQFILFSQSATPVPSQTPTPTFTPLETPTPTTSPTPTAYNDLIPGVRVFASSVYSPAYIAEYAVDGNVNTPWGSDTSVDSQWIYVDLGPVTTVNGIALYWYNDYFPLDYSFYTSIDGITWTFKANIIKQYSGDDVYIDNINISTKYIAVLCNKKNKIVYGLGEFEVYQLVMPPDPTPSPTPFCSPWIYPKWYGLGDCCSYDGIDWECISYHYANETWPPPVTQGYLWNKK